MWLAKLVRDVSEVCGVGISSLLLVGRKGRRGIWSVCVGGKEKRRGKGEGEKSKKFNTLQIDHLPLDTKTAVTFSHCQNSYLILQQSSTTIARDIFFCMFIPMALASILFSHISGRVASTGTR